MKVDLDMMLAARDRRVDIQNSMLANAASDSCLVCLTLNIAGDVKRTPMSRMLFDRGISELDKLGLNIIEHLEIDEPTGTESFWLIQGDAAEVKRKLEIIEDDAFNPASRLFDFDVLINGDFGIEKLTRKDSRRCLLCERPAAECARSRSHGLDAIKAETERLLREFCADTLARAAYDALIAELETTPKPGLIDMNNNGSHQDMDAALMRKSAGTLVSYFKDAAHIGMSGGGMKELRTRGIEADREMFEATGGVNTHQGMVYSMGLLLAGMGASLRDGSDFLASASALAREDAEKSYGATAHAVSGFPDAVYCADRLAHYKETENDNDAAVYALMDSIARVEDTNLLRRGGPEGLEFARQSAAEISKLPEADRLEAVAELDIEMIKRNLSPGGSADMLALAFLLDKWKEMSLNL